MEASRSGKLLSGTPPRGAPLESKRATGSGTGSSDNDSLASEVGRLSEENAQLSRKLSEILGKTPASPPSTRGGAASLSGSSGERVRFSRDRCRSRYRACHTDDFMPWSTSMVSRFRAEAPAWPTFLPAVRSHLVRSCVPR